MTNIYKGILTLLIIGILMIPTIPALAFYLDMDLSDADASFWGEDTDDRAGLSVSGAGDVNGDGFDDFLIGAHFDDDGGNNAGQTYLIFGKASGWNMDTDLSNADASFRGEDGGDESGFSVSGAGDVNGDGFDDFLIGAYGDDDGGDNAGQTYLILGKASGWNMDIDLSATDASFRGEDAGDWAGRSVSGAGDVNGDGYDDILIGAYYNNDGGPDAGQTYLILGNAAADWGMYYSLGSANASFRGEHAMDWSGISVSGAGDVNGDGFDDFLIGALANKDGGSITFGAGQTYLIFGKASGWNMDTDLSNADASFWGEDADDMSGSVSGAGDVNGDGFDDFLIGAYGDDDGGGDAGQTYLILGKASGWNMDTDLSASDASFRGEEALDGTGAFISGAGDVNGDGYDDFLIGAPLNEEGGGGYTGQTYLILGKAFGWNMDTDLSNADASFWGEGIGDMSGCQVSAARDVNGDGYDDILIGAWGDDDGGMAAGQTYLILSDYARRGYKEYVPSGDSLPIEFSSADVTIDFSACTGNGFVTVKEIDGKPHRNISAGRYWSLNSSGISGFTYDVTIKYNAAQISEAGCGEADLRLFINDGTGWKKHPFTPDLATNRITATGLTTMCDIAFGDGNSSFIPPVSEILTIVFVAMGLIALGVFFYYRRRRKLVVAV